MPCAFQYPDVKQIIVCGDIHGNFKDIIYKLCVRYGCTDTLLIVAGDCGFGFEKPGYYEIVFNQVARRLQKANNYVVFVRGNHDDPSYFQEEKIHHTRWRCVPDYSVIRAWGHNILCVGGAVSVDRMVRQDENAKRRELGQMQTALWWENEAPVFLPERIRSIPEEIRIDTVVTHTAPSSCELLSKTGLRSWAYYDPGLIADVDDERKVMDELLASLKEYGHPLKKWFYGHFHASWNGEQEGILFIMLNIEEFKAVL